MFYTLLLVTFLLVAAVSFGVVRLFDKPVSKILNRVMLKCAAVRDEQGEAH